MFCQYMEYVSQMNSVKLGSYVALTLDRTPVCTAQDTQTSA